jgi:PPK2 family polyphosphate:nucleotide phosphotransferase
MLSGDVIKRFCVREGDTFRLAGIDPGDTLELDIEKDDAKELLQQGVKRLRDLQERLYAEGRWSLLIVLQAMDAAGKDSTIEHVMCGVNPQGCQVTTFKAPTPVELRHDFLWRASCALPERGRIGIFNRSYYEEVLVVRVHRELLEKQGLPTDLMDDDLWEDRFQSIREFERHLARNGTAILKFFLHVSREEQRRRFLKRIDEPDKRWKFAAGDVPERKRWSDYMEAYEDAIRNTAAKDAPWYIVPADNGSRAWWSPPRSCSGWRRSTRNSPMSGRTCWPPWNRPARRWVPRRTNSLVSTGKTLAIGATMADAL